MFAGFVKIRTTVLIASFAAFSAAYALAGPGSPVAIPHGSNSAVAAMGPGSPLPPFPPETGSVVAAKGPGSPLPPFPPETGSISRIA